MTEQFYDDEIAPKLKELCDACKQKGVPFLALVEYDPGSVGRTEFTPASAGIGQRIATWAARANGNIDSLMIAVQRHAKEHGHNSLILSILERK